MSRERVKELFAADELTLDEALSDRRAAMLPISELLQAVEGIGPVRAHQYCLRAGLGHWLRCGDLSKDQHARLVEVYAEREGG